MSATDVRAKSVPRPSSERPEGQPQLDEARAAQLRAAAAEADHSATIDITKLSRGELRKALFP